MRLKLIYLLIFIIYITGCGEKSKTIYDDFAYNYLNDPLKYEYIYSDTIDFYELLDMNIRMAVAYANFETAVARSYPLLGISTGEMNIQTINSLVDSVIMPFNFDTTSKEIEILEKQAVLEGIKFRINNDRVKFNLSFADYSYSPGVIFINHKYRTRDNNGNIIIESSILSVDTTIQKVVAVNKVTY